jgi:glycosyltransferase involved in cell wall biosynthesis
MKVLHLYSDWKWTGAAEPTINLVRALQLKGLEVVFACRKQPGENSQSIEKAAAKRGLKALTSFHLNRYFSPHDNISDLRLLPKVLRQEGFDIVHCHLSHDHFIGGWAAKRRELSLPLVRTNHKGRPLKAHTLNRWLMSRWTDALVTFSKKAAETDTRNFRIPRERIRLINASVNLEHFDPERVNGDLRGSFGFSPSDVVVGIVARMQRHRRFDVFFESIARVKQRIPAIKVLVLGRGTHMETVAVNNVVFAGYRKEDYREALSCIDIKVFLVPGSDGTCRAVREAMAMGKPVVAGRRGMLPEIVEHGTTGLVVTDTPEELGEAILKLATDTGLRRKIGQEARKKALREFRIDHQADKMIELYSSLLEH